MEALLTLDGTIAAKAHQPCSYLRHEYQASNRHLLRRAGVQKALITSRFPSRHRRQLLGRFDKGDPPVLVVFHGLLGPSYVLEGEIRQIIQEMGSYCGDIKIFVVCRDEGHSLEDSRCQYAPGIALPNFSTATAQVSIRQFVVQRLNILSVENTSIITNMEPPNFARVLELKPGVPSIVHCCIRHRLPKYCVLY